MKKIYPFLILPFVGCMFACQQIEPVENVPSINKINDSLTLKNYGRTKEQIQDSINKSHKKDKTIDKIISDDGLMYNWSYKKAFLWVKDMAYKHEKKMDKIFEFEDFDMTDYRYTGMGNLSFQGDYRSTRKTLSPFTPGNSKDTLFYLEQRRICIYLTPLDNNYKIRYEHWDSGGLKNFTDGNGKFIYSEDGDGICRDVEGNVIHSK